MKFVFLTGASGSGKTTALRMLADQRADALQCYFFDSVGVPTEEEMSKKFGSGDNWQRQTTLRWVKEMVEHQRPDMSSILDGQMRLAFIGEACEANNLQDYKIILMDCDDATRRERLVARGQDELANDRMMNWATYLRREAKADPRAVMLDNSKLTLQETGRELEELIGLISHES